MSSIMGMFSDRFDQLNLVKHPLYLKISVILFMLPSCKWEYRKKRMGQVKKNMGRNRQSRSTSTERFVISNCDN